ncbi:MAG: MBOAT family O-acyltransferase [Rickettsiales bacterium]|nr:MBOAT family O-acyltransferase [Rickettsiales bacterium]
MLFNEELFITLFLPIWLMAFGLIIPRSKRLVAHSIIIVASLIFYSAYDYTLTYVLLLSIAINYITCQRIRSSLYAKRYLYLNLAFNIGTLAYFKYSCFLLENAALLLALKPTVCDVTLPLGISFFTFQQIAFCVDSYRNRNQPVHASSYMAFVTFFPHLIAGPIVRRKDLYEALDNESYRLSRPNLEIGLACFLYGFLQKVMLADPLAIIVNASFTTANERVLTFAESILASFAFTGQIYFDFNGYSTMAIGLAWMIGIALPSNFETPYRSRSITDFWKRWHITLGSFFRDYVYIPLGGNQHGLHRQCLFLLITMLLCGLWHGAGWTFILWGVLNGIALVTALLYRRYVPLPIPALLGWLLTFVFVVMGWVLFRAESFASAINVFVGFLAWDTQTITAFSESYKQAIRQIIPSSFTTEAILLPQELIQTIACTHVAFAMLAALLLPSSTHIIMLYDRLVHSGKQQAYILRIALAVISAVVLAKLLQIQSYTAVNFIYFNF